ncbi:MAG: hypothetical protein ABIR58_06610 [Gemmatimonadaceae bacterium]
MNAAPESLLRRGIEVQIQNDSTSMVSEIVSYVLAERRGVRWLDAGMRAASGTRLPDYFAVANGVRCFLRMRTVGSAGGILACARRDNERRAVKELRGAIGSLAWGEIRFDFHGALDPARVGMHSHGHLARAADLARHLRRDHDMFHVLRALELVFYYDRIGRILDRGRYRVAVMSSYSNPWGIALNLAAHRRGIPVVHVMHGVPVWPVPRLDYELAIVNNQASYELLLRAGCRIDRVIVKSGQGRYRPLPLSTPKQPVKVGLLLSKQPRKESVSSWIRGLLANDGVQSVLVRPHPANLWGGLPAALNEFPADRVETSNGGTDEDIRRCDLVIAGNSSVHVDALTAGVPAVYAKDLDHSSGDPVSFLAEGLVFSADDPHTLRVSDATRFYGTADWIRGFRRHVNLDQSDAEVAGITRSAIDDLLSRSRT